MHAAPPPVYSTRPTKKPETLKVKRGLVSVPELWAWSSYRAYAFGEAGPVRLNDWPKIDIAVTVEREGLSSECPPFENHVGWGTHI